MRGRTLRWWSVAALPVTSHCVQHRIPIRTAYWLVVGATLAAACAAPDQAPTDVPPPRSCTGYVDPTHCPPFATGGPYSVSGVLTLRTTSGTAPLANAGVGGYVIMTNGNSYSMVPVVTDAEGRYRFSNVPNGVVVLNGSAAHAYQPCAAVATVNGANSVKDVQLQDSATTRPATSADSPTLSGVVYSETALGNQQPLAGAVIEFKYPPVVAATTVTDAEGRYAFCQLPAGRGGLDVWLHGVSLGGVVVSIIGDQVLDLHF